MSKLGFVSIAGLFLVAASTTAMAQTAQPTSVELTFIGKDSGCPGGKSMCFELAQGSLADLAPGAVVHLRFENEGNLMHMLMVTTPDKADSNHRATPEYAALPGGGIEDVPAGGSGNTTFTVPSDATGLYFWCGVPGHEVSGMWLSTTFGGSSSGKAPMPIWTSLAGLALTASFLRRRA